MAFDTRIKNKFRANMAESLLREFDSLSGSRFFLFFGKNSKWENENRPDLVVDCVRSDLDAWIDMLGAVRITRSDACLVIPRNQWISGMIYTEYDDTVDLANPYNPKPFYVTTSENKVYKCISNAGGKPSLEQPTSTTTSIFCTSDGYRWKFMYQIPDDLYYKFATDTKIPVEYIEDGFTFTGGLNNVRSLQLAVQQAAVQGSIENIVIESLGDSFPLTSLGSSQVVAVPGRVGDTKIWVLPAGIPVGTNLNLAGGLIGYSIYFKSGLGSGQICEITEAEWGTGSVAGLLGLTIREPLVRPISASENRTEFQILPTAKVFGDGSGCQLICKMEEVTGTNCDNTYQIQRIDVLTPGKGYTNAEVVIGPTDALAPKVRAIISPKGGHGSDAITELGASEVMVYASTRSGIAGDLPQINNFRQFGLIRNPKIGRGINAGEYAGEEEIEGYKIRIKKPETIVVKIKFWATDKEGRHTYNPRTGNFLPGQLVRQFTSGAVGRVERWIPPVAVNGECVSVVGEDPTGFLYIEPINSEKFRNDPTDPIVGFNEENIAVGPTYWFFAEEDNFVSTIGYTSETFDPGKFVIGVDSLTTAKISAWEVGTDGTDGYLTLVGVNGEFRGATVDAFGTYVEGERIVQVSGVDQHSGIFYGGNFATTSGLRETNIGILSGNPQREIFTRATYDQTYEVTTTVFGNAPSLFDTSGISYLSLDSRIDVYEYTGSDPRDSNAELRKIGTASVVDYQIIQNEEQTSVLMNLTSLRGWNRNLDGWTANNTNQTGILLGLGKGEDGKPIFLFQIDTESTVTPDLQVNSGEIVYIDNIRAITRNPERLEEFKLILRF